ncbi:MAG: sigma-70 family RNA polymerase sigma factor [Ruminococcus sp.]|nr:sigma-70 family RNA polymerase sigma factor [Ruminococcus sp.]MBR2284707.1 sigma-70 family RNA polymerase sigma factor [Ruminococcus sp.]
MTDIEITAMLKKSPHECHRMLLKEYSRYVYAIVYNKLRSCASTEDIEECVSDTFADLFIALDEGNCTDIKNMAGTIAKRRAIDRFRSLAEKSGRTVSIDGEEVRNLASEMNVEEISEGNELRRMLLRAIASLGEPDATIIIQKFYYDRSSSEIAKDVSMNASSVRSRSTRAMKKLRAMLESEGITV